MCAHKIKLTQQHVDMCLNRRYEGIFLQRYSSTVFLILDNATEMKVTFIRLSQLYVSVCLFTCFQVFSRVFKVFFK